MLRKSKFVVKDDPKIAYKLREDKVGDVNRNTQKILLTAATQQPYYPAIETAELYDAFS